jgi:hypothetical protein
VTHPRLPEPPTELIVVDFMTVAARPHSRIVLVEVGAGSPKVNMVLSEQGSQRKWKLIGFGMTPPTAGASMALTLEAVEGDERLSRGVRLTSD